MTGIFILSIVLTAGGLWLWRSRPAHQEVGELISQDEHRAESRLLWVKNKTWSVSLVLTFLIGAVAATSVVFLTKDSFERQFGLVVCLLDWIMALMFFGAMVYWNHVFAGKKNI